MKRGKHICNTLKEIRRQIAKENNIEYNPRECTHNEDCLGTCPACESERMYLEKELSLRKSMGKAVSIIGISAGLTTLSVNAQNVESQANVPVKDSTENPIRVTASQVEDMLNSITNTQEVYVLGSVTPTDANLVSSSSFSLPQFPGGESALNKYLSEMLDYSKGSLKEAKGTVFTSFTVEEDGKLSEITVLHGINNRVDKECIRILRNMPAWKPATRDGKPVKQRYELPITIGQ